MCVKIPSTNSKRQVYTMGYKKAPTNSCPYLRQILTDFENSVTDTLCGKFATADY